MAEYLVMRLEAGKLNYGIISKYPQFKEAVDKNLSNDGYTVNSDGIAIKSE